MVGDSINNDHRFMFMMNCTDITHWHSLILCPGNYQLVFHDQAGLSHALRIVHAWRRGVVSDERECC